MTSEGQSMFRRLSHAHVITHAHVALAACLLLGTALCGPNALRAADFTPEDAKTLADAQLAHNAKEFDKALTLLTPLRAKYPDQADIPRLMAHSLFELGRLDESQKLVSTAIGLGRLTPDLVVRLAQFAEKKQDQIALVNVVRLLTILEPDNTNWRILYGNLLSEMEAYAESAQVYRALLDKQPASGELHLRLGNVQLQQQRLAEAAVTLEAAWRLGAAEPRLPRILASLWRQLDDPQQALAWTQLAVTLAGPEVEASLRLQLAQLFNDVEDFEQAQQQAIPLLELPDPQLRAQAHLLLGRLEARRDRLAEAMVHWEKAVALGVESSPLRITLGAYFYNHQDFVKAAQFLRQVVDEEDGRDEQRLRFLIVSLIRSQDQAGAREYLTRYLERHGFHDESRTLIRLFARPVQPVPGQPVPGQPVPGQPVTGTAEKS